MKSPTKSQVYAAASAAIAIAILSGLVGFYLGSENAQADYFTNVLLSFCAGLLVSIVFTFIIQNILSAQSTIELYHHRQIATTVGLYERFHSPEMVEMRCCVDKLFGGDLFGKHTLNEIHSKLYIESDDVQDNKKWVALSALLHFFENLADLHEAKLVDEDTIKSNFQKYFNWFSQNEKMKETLRLSKENGEEWFFFTRWQYLQEKAKF